MMLATALDAKARLEAEGLHVSRNSERSLWIAATLHNTEGGITLSDDACALIADSDQWVAVFPADGLRTYEVAGSLSQLVSLILDVYAVYHRASGPLKEAFKQVVRQPEQYLSGRSPAVSNGMPEQVQDAKAEEASPPH